MAKAKRSLVRIPYKTFCGKRLIVRGFKNRGLYEIEIIERAKTPIEDNRRYMYCRIQQAIRDVHNLGEGQLALIPIRHDIKDIIKTLHPLTF